MANTYHSLTAMRTHETTRDRFRSNMTMRNWNVYVSSILHAEYFELLRWNFKDFVDLYLIADCIWNCAERLTLSHAPKVLKNLIRN